jgi:hypothetical protein
MKKLLIGAALCALFAAPSFAGEPVKLSSTQMDKVTAGWGGSTRVCQLCTNAAAIYQANVNYSAFSHVRQKNDADVRQSIN